MFSDATGPHQCLGVPFTLGAFSLPLGSELVKAHTMLIGSAGGVSFKSLSQRSLRRLEGDGSSPANECVRKYTNTP